jgi:transcriptional regulator with XRE-family HTH domain
VLLRRVIGDALRARRQGQRRTLREVSSAANVSLGYLSEIERGQKEASSELLAAICQALGSRLSEVLREATDHLARAELAEQMLADGQLTERPAAVGEIIPDPLRPTGTGPQPEPTVSDEETTVSDGEVSVSVRRDGPLRTTLHTVRSRPGVARTS